MKQRLCGLVSMLLALFLFHTQALAQEKGANIVKARVDELAAELIDALIEAEERYTGGVAVLDFSNIGEDTEKLKIAETVTELLRTALGRSERITLIEEKKRIELLKEISFAMTGAVDPATAAEAGNMVGAQRVNTGMVVPAGNFFTITARVIEVETAKVLFTTTKDIQKSYLIAASDEMYNIRKFPITACFRSLIVPGWGQFFNDKPVKGSVFLTTEAAVLVGALLLNKFGNDEYSKYEQNTPDMVDRYDNAEQFYMGANIALGVAGALHFFNLVDAYLDARKFNKEIEKGKKGLAAKDGGFHLALYPQAGRVSVRWQRSF